MTRANQKPLQKKHLEELLKKACQASKELAKISTRYFAKPLRVTQKNDSSPVTQADRESELRFRDRIRKAFPEHRICGEEFPDEGPPDAEWVWYVDPIDGTLMYTRGLPYWGSVIGLCYRGEVVVGSVDYPLLDTHMQAAKGLGCRVNGRKQRVSKTRELRKASLLYNCFLQSSPQKRAQLMKALTAAKDARGFGDCYAHALLVLGKVDAVLDARIQAHDVCGIKICVEEAGGTFSDWKGKKQFQGPDALSSNGLLHSTLLRRLQAR